MISSSGALDRGPMIDTSHCGDRLAARYRGVREMTLVLTGPLEPEDYVLQSMTDASPAKWHLAHTTWFFETFLLSPNAPNYKPFHERFSYLFNSYYNAVGERILRGNRGLISRPSVAEVMDYRSHVDRHMSEWLERETEISPELAGLIELGLNHEQQHQELILTDLKHAFSLNPIAPVYRERSPNQGTASTVPMRWQGYEGGLFEFGHQGEGFAFDNESPRHEVFLRPFELAGRLVTNREYLVFLDDDAYRRPEFWLSEGWEACRTQGWNAPLYWTERDGRWWQFTLSGARLVEPDEPVTHVSFFEADAFARWSEARLPTEYEWELAAREQTVQGNLLDAFSFHPMPAVAGSSESRLLQVYGDAWEWTSSAYLGYPGFRPAGGAVGEYNGKFMCNQFVLRGGSCATPKSHIRATYRNFFPPPSRWQFSGIRLARDPD